MTLFKNLTAEDVAAQHQLLIEMLLHGMSAADHETRSLMVKSIDTMVDAFASAGRDATLLADAAASLRRQNDEA